MSDTGREDRIREEAFLLWNADGRPEGRAEEYWRRAERTIDEMDRLTTREAKRGDL
jgi:hypothetical protein